MRGARGGLEGRDEWQREEDSREKRREELVFVIQNISSQFARSIKLMRPPTPAAPADDLRLPLFTDERLLLSSCCLCEHACHSKKDQTVSGERLPPSRSKRLASTSASLQRKRQFTQTQDSPLDASPDSLIAGAKLESRSDARLEIKKGKIERMKSSSSEPDP